MRSVYVAGSGAITAFGAGRDALFDGIFAGRSAIRPVRRLRGGDHGALCAAEIDGDAPRPEDLARAALEECGERDTAAELVVASTKADLSGIVGPGDGLGNPQRLAARLGPDRPRVFAVSCACASGLAALALAARRIATGTAESVAVVGVDVLSPFVLAGFSSLLALDPEPCRPYDRGRGGLTLGEGAAAMVLTARETGVRVRGWAMTNDANHITGPREDGEGVRAAAARALAAAGLQPGDIDYVHTHATGTPFFDAMEGQALLALYPAGSPPVSGTKAQTGHTLGAAGVIESIIAIEALRRREAPANRNLRATDLDPRVDLVREPRPLTRARHVLKLSSGFGGINVAVVFGTS